MLVEFRLRVDTLAEWTRVNPVLDAGEPAIESDTGRQRIGDGTTAFLDLPVQSADPAAFQAITDAAVAAATAAAVSAADAAAAAGGGSPATTTTPGVVILADNTVTATGTDATKAVTPAGLASRLSGISTPDASTSVKGLIQVATNTEAIAGTNTGKAVTPAGVAAALSSAGVVVLNASTTVTGIVRLATNSEAITGTDTAKVITPAALLAVLTGRTASTSATGLVRLATNGEAVTGVDTAKAITPAALAAAIAATIAVNATDTVAGRVELATPTEAIAGVDSVRAVTPQGLEARVDTHNVDSGAHSGILALKADLVTGLVPVAQLPLTDTPVQGLPPVFGPSGALQVGQASLANHALQMTQAQQMISDALGGGSGQAKKYARLTSILSANPTAATWTDLPTLNFTEGKSGKFYWVDLALTFRALTVNGLQVRVKTNAAAPTNLLPNPSFETDVSGWNTISNVALTTDNTHGAQDGSQAMRITISTTQTVNVWSDWMAYHPGDVVSVGNFLKRVTTTARSTRCDVQFGDSTATNTALVTGVVQSQLGTVVSPGTSTFAQSKSEGASCTVAGVTKVRVKIVVLSAVSGDILVADAAQLEPSSTLPAFGSTAGGSSVMTVDGSFLTPQASGTPVPTTPPVKTKVRYPAVSNLTGQAFGHGITTDAEFVFSGEVGFGGSGLTNQRIEFQYAMLADTATASQIVSGNAEFAEVA